MPTCITRGKPLVIPPWIPPLLLVVVVILSPSMVKASFTSEPRREHMSKPPPKDMPLMAGTPKITRAKRFSMPSKFGFPRPIGRPVATTSTIPPVESPSFFSCITSFSTSLRLSASSIAIGSVAMLPSAFISGWTISIGASWIVPTCFKWPWISMPFSRNSWIAMPPATHRGAVRRAEKWPPPRISTLSP